MFVSHAVPAESRIMVLQQQLSTYPKKLVDEEGFPLANVDVRQPLLCPCLSRFTPCTSPGSPRSEFAPRARYSANRSQAGDTRTAPHCSELQSSTLSPHAPRC